MSGSFHSVFVESTAEMSNLGKALVKLTVNSMKAFEIILTQVYLD